MGLLIREELASNTLLGVWKIEEDEDWYFSHEHLTPRVQNRIDAFKSQQRKLQAIAVRILIKTLLPNEDNVDIDYNENSKPYFIKADYNLSITHSHSMVAVLFSDQIEVGVDIEKRTEKVERVGHKFMNLDELRMFNNLDASVKMDYLHVIWGAKESMYKLYGKGSMDFRKHIIVPKFELKSDGEFVGVIGKDDRLVRVNGFYTNLDKFVLVYVLERK